MPDFNCVKSSNYTTDKAVINRVNEQIKKDFLDGDNTYSGDKKFLKNIAEGALLADANGDKSNDFLQKMTVVELRDKFNEWHCSTGTKGKTGSGVTATDINLDHFLKDLAEENKEKGYWGLDDKWVDLTDKMGELKPLPTLDRKKELSSTGEKPTREEKLILNKQQISALIKLANNTAHMADNSGYMNPAGAAPAGMDSDAREIIAKTRRLYNQRVGLTEKVHDLHLEGAVSDAKADIAGLDKKKTEKALRDGLKHRQRQYESQIKKEFLEQSEPAEPVEQIFTDRVDLFEAFNKDVGDDNSVDNLGAYRDGPAVYKVAKGYYHNEVDALFSEKSDYEFITTKAGMEQAKDDMKTTEKGLKNALKALRKDAKEADTWGEKGSPNRIQYKVIKDAIKKLEWYSTPGEVEKLEQRIETLRTSMGL